MKDVGKNIQTLCPKMLNSLNIYKYLDPISMQPTPAKLLAFRSLSKPNQLKSAQATSADQSEPEWGGVTSPRGWKACDETGRLLRFQLDAAGVLTPRLSANCTRLPAKHPKTDEIFKRFAHGFALLQTKPVSGSQRVTEGHVRSEMPFPQRSILLEPFKKTGCYVQTANKCICIEILKIIKITSILIQ